MSFLSHQKPTESTVSISGGMLRNAQKFSLASSCSLDQNKENPLYQQFRHTQKVHLQPPMSIQSLLQLNSPREVCYEACQAFYHLLILCLTRNGKLVNCFFSSHFLPNDPNSLSFSQHTYLTIVRFYSWFPLCRHKIFRTL